MGGPRSPGTLHVVATPIGNLEDASPRIGRTLADCRFVLCEDTRRTGKLLQALGVEARLVRCDAHLEARRIEEVLAALRAGDDVALVSDAGTPCISDPGERLVAAVVAEGLPVSPVPGPSAVMAALSASGLPTDAFVFEGFPPRKAGARRRLFAALADEPRTCVLLETPHRILAMLDDAVDAFGADRPACLGRELTKLHEELIHGTLGSIRDAVASRETIKGEIVLVLGGAPPPRAQESDPDAVRARVDALTAGGIEEREALRQAARELGLTRRDVYRIVKLEPRDDEK